MARGVGGHSPSNIAGHLSGIDFPVQRNDLVQHARSQGAEDGVIEVLEQMPEGEYGNMADVMKGVGKVE